MGEKVEGKTVFEVGTGHCPIVPIGFFLCGAEKVITVDLHRRLDFGILKKSLVWMAENRDEICGYYEAVANPQITPQRNRLRISQGKQITPINERMDLIDSLKHRPKNSCQRLISSIWRPQMQQILIFLMKVWIIISPQQFLSIFAVKILSEF